MIEWQSDRNPIIVRAAKIIRENDDSMRGLDSDGAELSTVESIIQDLDEEIAAITQAMSEVVHTLGEAFDALGKQDELINEAETFEKDR